MNLPGSPKVPLAPPRTPYLDLTLCPALELSQRKLSVVHYVPVASLQSGSRQKGRYTSVFGEVNGLTKRTPSVLILGIEALGHSF